MRGLKESSPDGTEPQNHTQTDGHGDYMTESAQRYQFSENAMPKELKGHCLVAEVQFKKEQCDVAKWP